jgi:hypothetical protein
MERRQDQLASAPRCLGSLTEVFRSADAIRKRVELLDLAIDLTYSRAEALETHREVLLEVLDAADSEFFGEHNEDVEREHES